MNKKVNKEKTMQVEDVKLYQLTGIYASLTEELEESGGELTPELEKALDEAEGLLSEKLERMGQLIKTLEADAEFWTARQRAFDAEAKRMKARADARAARVDSIKRYIAQCLETADVDKLKTETFSFWLQTDHAVEATGEEIDPIFVRIKEELDKKALLEHWKALPSDEQEQHRLFKGAKIVTKRGLRLR